MQICDLEEQQLVGRDVYKRQVLEGTEVQILADVVAQLYACLTECRFVGPLGLAAYAELSLSLIHI